MATFENIPHIGEKIFGFLKTREDFKNCLLVCKNWNSILENPTFWLYKLKELDQNWTNQPKLQKNGKL